MPFSQANRELGLMNADLSATVADLEDQVTKCQDAAANQATWIDIYRSTFETSSKLLAEQSSYKQQHLAAEAALRKLQKT